MMKFSESDYQYAKSLGISKYSLDAQGEMLKNGFPKIALDRPATIGDGIIRLSKEEERELIRYFDEKKEHFKMLKFVPASGAASRMFQPFRALRSTPESKGSISVISNLYRFPFFDDIKQEADKKGISINALQSNVQALADFILEEAGMGFDSMPKGLVTFYNKGEERFNAFQLHLQEANDMGISEVHFTVSKKYLEEIKATIPYKNIGFSIQKSATDYICKVNEKAFRDDKGQLILRPSGHGALLDNLNEIDAQIYSRLNMLYAKDYKISTDFQILWKGFRKLGAKV